MKKLIAIVAILSCLASSSYAAETPPSMVKGEWDAAKAETMRELLSFVKESKEFVVEQAPLVAQEIIKWGIIGNIYELSAWIIVLVVSIITMRYVIIYIKANCDETGKEPFIFLSGILAFVAVVGGFMSVLGVFCCVNNLFFIYSAPRLYLIQTISGMLK
jgi:hypothetical protein